MQDVLGGDIIVIDTENRARKYANVQVYAPDGKPIGRPLSFLVVDFDPPFRADRFREAILAQLPRKPACIIVDSISDEHDGEGGRLDWHEEVIDDILRDRNSNVENYDPRARSQQGARFSLAMEGWQMPSAARKRLAASINRIGSTPLILNFRAEEKTKPKKQQKNGREVNVPTNIGYQPIAPAMIVHALDVVCLLPARADGVPKWRSDRTDQDFVLKLPTQFRNLFTEGRRITPEIGAALATWAKGEPDGSGTVAPETRPVAPAAPASEMRRPTKTFGELLDEIIQEDGFQGLLDARAHWDQKGDDRKVRWIDDRWEQLAEKARAADAKRAVAEPETSLPGI
jgi:hypothetical protein